MDLKFFQELDLELTKYKARGQAAQGAPLNIIRIMEPISFFFTDNRHHIFKKIIVIQNLSHQINLGGTFCKEIGLCTIINMGSCS